MISSQHFNLQDVKRLFLQQPNIRGFLSTTFFLLYTSVIGIPFLIRNRFYYFTISIKYTLISFFIISLFALLQIFTIGFTNIFNPFYAFFTNRLTLTPGNIVGLRPSPFVYEPRYFGLAMGYAAMLVFLLRLFPIPNIPNFLKSNMLMSLFVLMLLFSASTSAVAGFVIGFSFVIIWLFRQNKINKLKLLFGIIITIIVLILSISLNDLILERFELYLKLGAICQRISGASNKLPMLAFIQWLLNKPNYLLYGVGFGNGAYYAYDYISMLSGFGKGGFLNARFSIIDLISSVGFLGFILLYLLWYMWIKKIHSKLMCINVKYKNYFKIALGMVLYLIGTGIINENYHFVWFYFGILFSFLQFYEELKLRNQERY